MAERGSGILGAIRDLASGSLPNPLRELQQEIDDRLRKIPTELNEYGYDRFGLHPDTARHQFLPIALMYRYYFRVESHGTENVPAGRAFLIGNHAGQLPFDAAMLAGAMLLDAEPPRLLRGMGEYFIPQLPFVSTAAERGGNMVGTPENCAALLEAGECVVAFPEGVRGMNKTYDQAYKLQRFGLGFLRLALETETPIVPFGIVGSEEQQPGLANIERLARPLGLPAFPVTLGFPWLGPLGLLPMPVKYRIHIGEPLRFQGSPTDEDGVIQEKVDRVRGAIEALLRQGRSERRGIFSG
jgi:1-acyl-sn-glycerol-3-phosphate acyltransferase